MPRKHKLAGRNKKRALARIKKMRGILKGGPSLVEELIRGRREDDRKRDAVLLGRR